MSAKRKVWALYKAPSHDALMLGLTKCETDGWTVFQVLDSSDEGEFFFTIVAFKVAA